MNKETMVSIINDEITDKLTQLIDEMSSSEFVEMITDKYYEQTGENLEDDEEVKELIGNKVFPLLTSVQMYVYENIVKN